MAAPKEIVNLVRKYTAQEVLPRLPREVGALTLEIIAWHIQLHAYQYEVFFDLDSEHIDTCVDAPASVLPTREGEPWQATMAWHRVERGETLQYEGEVLYERWPEL